MPNYFQLTVRTKCYTHRKILKPERVLYKLMELDFPTDKECKDIVEGNSGKKFDNIDWPLDVSCAFRRYNETKADILKEIARQLLLDEKWKEVIFKIQ